MDLLILKAASIAEHADCLKFQARIEQCATDQNQNVHALSITLLMDTHASNVLKDKYLMTLDSNAILLQPAMVLKKFLVPDKTATDAKIVHQILFQMIQEQHALDQFQFAHAPKNTLQMDMNAKNVQLDMLLIQTIIKDAFHKIAAIEMRFSWEEIAAIDVNIANKDMNQTQLDLNVLELNQHVHALSNMTQLDMNAFHAHSTMLPQTKTKDVFQDNAQDLTKFLVLSINAINAENVRRDQLQITSDKDA